MLNFPPTGTDLVIGLAAFLLGWYLFGLHLSRRRGGALVRQIRDSIQFFGGAATIRWIGRSAFRIEVEPLAPPLSRLGVSLLLEPRETFLLWAFGRLSGRRDWLMVSATLSGGVKGAFEVYHPRRRGGGDSAHEVRSLGWAVEPFPGRAELLCAAPGPDGRALAQEVMGALRGLEIWGVRVRNKEPQLTVSLPLPVTETRVPLPIFPLLAHLAQLILAGGFSHEPQKEEKR
ncbi:MAG: hypothetical protein NTW68_18975 [candidate division NC10 bacterium]|nr:hypothetical protein [candidate division NC10 bacterium]